MLSELIFNVCAGHTGRRVSCTPYEGCECSSISRGVARTCHVMALRPSHTGKKIVKVSWQVSHRENQLAVRKKRCVSCKIIKDSCKIRKDTCKIIKFLAKLKGVWGLGEKRELRSERSQEKPRENTRSREKPRTWKRARRRRRSRVAREHTWPTRRSHVRESTRRGGDEAKGVPLL